MKKSLINIGILLFIDLLLIYTFYFLGTPEGVEIPSFDRQAQWKIDVGKSVIVIAITYQLLKEVIRFIRKIKQDS